MAKLRKDHGITFTAFHRDDQPSQVRAVIAGNYPAVVALDTQGEYALFMDSAQIEICTKSPQKFLQQIIAKIATASN